MVTTLAKRAMTTKGQKATMVIDHLIGALGSDSSSSLRRAMILTDIAQYSGTTQVAIMKRLNLDKSTVKREIDWLFDYGCIRLSESAADKRAKTIEIYGYSKEKMKAAMAYFDGQYEYMKMFLDGNINFLRQEKPTLRDAKIVATLHERGDAAKAEILSEIDGAASTNHRSYNKLVDDGVIVDG
ncbi:MAG: MarR family winged helix-turn-helix transcriptional regulator [Micavibrio sp.]|nr:MarR family winged helix-turn-helix transcriptional regulator [Micavibrio sp.]